MKYQYITDKILIISCQWREEEEEEEEEEDNKRIQWSHQDKISSVCMLERQQWLWR